jgi:sigma-B regulation protein RsbU (phosphoserine phosphatase)
MFLSFMASLEENLRLTDFMDLPTLQEIQDSFAAVANVKATITDADGKLLTQPTPTSEFLQRQRVIAQAEEDVPGPQREGRVYIAPIVVNNQRLGTIRMTSNGTTAGLDDAKMQHLAEKFGIDAKQMKAIVTTITKAKDTRPAAIQFLFMLANAIARLCFQEHQLRQRIDELTAVYNLSNMLTDARDLQTVLQRIVELTAAVMEASAASLRLVDHENDELVTKAVVNLSQDYLNKGPIRLSKSEIDQVALGPKGYELVQNMATDPRVQYPQQAEREGIVSQLSAGMRYKGKAIGVLRVYSNVETHFNPFKIELLKAIAAQAAAAIENARLLAESIEAEQLEKQRMIPAKPPMVPGLDLAAVYVPCFELGGDFYDFIELPDKNLGLVISDVAGKGVPASLIMASVRAALRAQVDNVYYLYEVVRRLNLMLCRDTKPSEFVTLFYGVIDCNNWRLTYCSAGHPPGLLKRNGKIIELGSENMVLGVDPDETYTQSFIDLERGDMLLLYTDGLTDGMNFQQETFGRDRIVEAFMNGGDTAEATAQHILWELRKFVGLSKRTDDVTMIVARVT